MRSATPRSIFAALCAVLLLATACSSSTTDTAGDAESAAVDTDAAGDDAPAVTTPDANAPADPALVEQYGFSLTGTPMSSEHTTCMLDLADGDTQLTAAFNGSSFTPEAFTALAISIHSCVEHDTLAASLLALGGADDEATQANFSECALEEIDDATDGDLTYVGLAALRVSFPVPEGAAESTVSAASNCVPVIGVANQVAAATEQGSGFLIEVDRDCLTDAIDDSFLTSFWESIVANEETEGLTDLVGDCSDEYDSGLPKEIPADFVAWSGEGTLAGVDPFVPARHGEQRPQHQRQPVLHHVRRRHPPERQPHRVRLDHRRRRRADPGRPPRSAAPDEPRRAADLGRDRRAGLNLRDAAAVGC